MTPLLILFIIAVDIIGVFRVLFIVPALKLESTPVFPHILLSLFNVEKFHERGSVSDIFIF